MWWHLKSLASRLFAQPFVQVQIKENRKNRRHWPSWGKPLVTGGFPSQRTSNAQNVSIWWHPHVLLSSNFNFEMIRLLHGNKLLVWCWSYLNAGGHLKNINKLLDLGALTPYEIHMFQCMGNIFCVEFQRAPLKFHTKYVTHTSKDIIILQNLNFLNVPLNKPPATQPSLVHMINLVMTVLTNIPTSNDEKSSYSEC